MKPDLIYRAPAAPKKAAKAVAEVTGSKPDKTHTEPGKWVRVWVPEGSKVTVRSAEKFNAYMREYQRKRRAEAKG